jgi:transcriptional regulator with XRE-family HTH domain
MSTQLTRHADPPEGHFKPKQVLPGILFTDVARGTGLSLSCVSRILNGSRGGSVQTLKSIAAYLTASTGAEYTIDRLIELIRQKPWLSDTVSSRRH